jgi:lysophospholipase L1-like esterase
MRLIPVTLCFLIVVAQAALAAAAAPVVEAVLSHEIVRATEEARRNGEASFIPLKDGSLLLLYGAHSKPGDWDRGQIRQIRSRDGGKTWSEPETVFSDPKRSLFQCSLARLPSGDLGLTHSSLANGTDAIKVFRRSSDEGKTWSEPIVISDKAHAYTTGPWDKLYVLESGRVLTLLHCNLKPNTTKQGGPLGSYAVYSDDDGKTWSEPTDLYRATEKDLWVDYPAVRWIDGNLHMVWRHNYRAATPQNMTSLYHLTVPAAVFTTARGADAAARQASREADLVVIGGTPGGIACAVRAAEPAVADRAPLRILPVGDSITRGSYLTLKDGKALGLPQPDGGGWRKGLQDRLRAAGIAFDFVGELDYLAYGRDGVVDPDFDPHHHGLAGFSNSRILSGGTVPTPPDVLAARGATEIIVPPLADVLTREKPDVILLMSGANGFDAAARDTLIRTIGEKSGAHLFVATILPQKAPRAGWENVDAYNASLPAVVAAEQAAGRRITLVDMHASLTSDDLLPDGVHPSRAGMEQIAAVWFAALTGQPRP